VSTFIDPDDVKTTPVVSKEAKSEFVDPDTFVDPEESPTPTVAPVAAAIPKAEDAPFLSNFGKILSLADTEAKKTSGKAVANAVDIVDLPLSAPAWIGGMAAGLVAANKHAADKLESVLIGTPEPAGLHFGAALAVSEDILHKFGNPLRKALTATGAVPRAADGTPTSGVATVMEKIGELFQLAGRKTEEFTGSAEAGKAVEFGSQVVVPAAALKGASLAISGAKKAGSVVKDAIVKDTPVKQADPKKIQPAESVAEVIQRKYERDALDTKIKAAEANLETKAKSDGESITNLSDTALIQAGDIGVSGHLMQSNVLPADWALLDRLGLLIEHTKEDGTTFKSADMLALMNERDARAKRNRENKKEVTSEEINATVERRAQNYDRVAKEQEALGDLGDKVLASKMRAKAAEIRSKKVTEPKTGKTRDSALAYNDKDGNIFINDVKAKADFEAGFPYIFDASTPTGKQKAAIFEGMGLTKEDFKKAIPDVETYTTFLKAHEESHIKHGDRGACPRTPEGKADLMHPDALPIETRATIDALKAINKPTAKDVVVSDVFEAILRETTEHPATREGASRIIEKALDNITADARLVDVFTKSIEHNVPDALTRSRMARAIEEHRRTDVLLTDAAKKELLERLY